MVCAGLPLIAGLWFAPLRAQEGGVVLTFGIAERLEASDNAGLNTPSSGNSLTSTTRLSFGLTSETRISRLALNAAGGLRAATGPGSSTMETGLTSPQLSLEYDRGVADASLNLRALLREDNIADANTIDLTDPTADIPLLDATGGGTKRSYSVDAALKLRQDAPLSFGLTAGLGGVSYIGTTDPDLVDNRSTRAGITANLALSEVATAKLGLRYTTYQEDTAGATRRVTKGFDAGVELERPNGLISANFSTDNTPDGTRNRLSFGRSFELPDGNLAADIGATRGVNGNISLTGGLDYRRDLPLGQINAKLRHDVIAGSDDTERQITALSLGYQRELTPLSSLRMNINYSDSKQTDTGDTTASTGIGVTYTRLLTEDWGLDLGYTHSRRRETGTTNSTARSNNVFLELHRSFTFRP